jgi:hypothetical protein
VVAAAAVVAADGAAAAVAAAGGAAGVAVVAAGGALPPLESTGLSGAAPFSALTSKVAACTMRSAFNLGSFERTTVRDDSAPDASRPAMTASPSACRIVTVIVRRICFAEGSPGVMTWTPSPSARMLRTSDGVRLGPLPMTSMTTAPTSLCASAAPPVPPAHTAIAIAEAARIRRSDPGLRDAGGVGGSCARGTKERRITARARPTRRA